MRVGLDAYLLHKGASYRAAGVSVYIQGLLSALPSAAPGHEYVAFTGREAPPVREVASVRAPIPVDRPPLRIAWEQIGLPLQAAWEGVGVLHGTVNTIPPLWRGPSVVTVHDLSFLRYPERLSRKRAFYLRFAVAQSARWATRVIAVSRNTGDDLVELAGVSPHKITVVYSGVQPGFRPLSDAQSPLTGAAFGGRPYILNVGTLEPRKNQDVLIRAYAHLRRRLGLPHVLAIVGARGWMYEPLFALVRELELERDVAFIDYVAPDDLPLWYNCADLFAYPSVYEGFGLPVLEAMACGVPVVTSSSSSLGELAGDACLTVDPGSEAALEAALGRIVQDPALRERLREAGLARAREFTWERTALDTVAVYRAAVEEA